MTDTYRGSGARFPLDPGATYVKGRLYFLGDIPAIAADDYVSADTVGVFLTEGVHELAFNASDTAVQGAPAYWDATNFELVDDPAGVHRQCGHFAEGTTDTTAKVKLAAGLSGDEGAQVQTHAFAAGATLALAARDRDVYLIVDTQGGAVEVDLPSAVLMPGRKITVVRAGTGVNAITLDQAGTETINGSASAVASLDAQHDTLTIQSDGVSNWTIVSAIIA